MPIYGYSCKSCDHSFDVLQKMSEPRLLDCPECGEASLKKQLSAPKFRLKGEGWYETDFKTGDKRNIAGESDKKSDTKKGDYKTSDKSSDKSEKKTEVKKKTETKATST
jgi:putative FmdB family regulatory protein